MLAEDENEVIVFHQDESGYTVYYRQSGLGEAIVLDNAVRIRFEGTYDEYESAHEKIAELLKKQELVRKSNDYCKIIQLDSKENFLVMDIYIAV